ncbi:hypothetical protein DIC75_11770 [Methanoculleus sp. CWC-02]|uniref:Uncharacterized protein n=1 Tax=Methanoculleus oceani TaxID=2184756 RepID=A0ABD4TIJ9_9EURY|nr:hypothetical protein [Methanoculleus sp. CWC-02]
MTSAKNIRGRQHGTDSADGYLPGNGAGAQGRIEASIDSRPSTTRLIDGGEGEVYSIPGSAEDVSAAPAGT